MELTVLTTTITEPVTKEEVKSFMGYPAAETSQDALIEGMITTAREYVESYTGLSVVSKSYKAYFDKDDMEDGYYTLPVAPVLSSPAIVVNMNGTTTTFEQVGLKTVRIRPDIVIGTVGVGSSATADYVEVIFTAGATNATANQIILRLASLLFAKREDGVNLSVARLPFDTRRLLDSLSRNM